MPPALCVAADVGRSPSQSRTDPPLSPLRTRPAPRQKRDAPSQRLPHLAGPPNRDPWRPIQQTPHQLHSPAPPPSLSYSAIGARVVTSSPSMFSLRDQAVETFEAALQKQGSLLSNGKMTSPTTHSPTRIIPPRVPALAPLAASDQRAQPASHEPFTPTT
ncbi:uncharacterized protein PHACADRAFT_258285 [Phanerochaete carnosa HHB-10118-sp]|uniref:Uncharacterized protein n=1 Tax=Phanerochaete carnosa (strain HHB-10118-sp) TaxID=650164 RepID=K5W664_PHACS|nr:uncharacterized protein PHACADRAFT_258285 [Phanerochaete carnosa HHB-10118-sp]EKM54439.1 hypothetical protein PHACADRAFT_258285 [Phanerochaete carnosa HHB-10118-sp]